MANDIDDHKKKEAVLLGANGYTSMRNLVGPDKPATKKYDELVKAHL